MFKQGDPIEAKVLEKNDSDQPMRYDGRTGESRWALLDPDAFVLFSASVWKS